MYGPENEADRPKGVKHIATDKGYVWHELEAYLRKKGIQPQMPRKKNAGPKLGTSSTEDVASISAGTDILMDAKKVWQNYGSMGANTTIFRCIFVFSHHGFVVAKIIGIG